MGSVADIAVIMSIYSSDRPKDVRRAMESILTQEGVSLDFHIQIDGPTAPGVIECVESLQLEHPNLIVRHRAENRGLAYSLNELLGPVMAANYRYIARMDADDVSLPGRLAQQQAYMEAHPEVDVVGSCAVEVLEDGTEFFRKRMPSTHEGCFRLFARTDCLVHPSAFFRRSFFEKAGLYSLDTYYAEDTMLWLQGFERGCRFANLPEYLYAMQLDHRFFRRRRGWTYAVRLLQLRCKVTRRLHYGLRGYFYAYANAASRLLSHSLLRVLYRRAR